MRAMTEVWKRIEIKATSVLKHLVVLDRKAKFGLIMLNDAVLCVMAVIIGFSLRVGKWDLWNPAIAKVTAVALALWLPIFLLRGIYRSVVRFVGTRTMLGLVTSCMIMMLGLSATFTANSVVDVPRTIAVIQPMVFACLLVINRLVARYILFDLLSRRSINGPRQRVLIYGAGSAGRQLALSLRHEPNMVLRGYVDDDDHLIGNHLDGVRVHGSGCIPRLVDGGDVDLVLLAMPQVSRQRREQIVRGLETISVRVMTLPAIGDVIDGSVSIGDLREIEITDLLGRDPVPPNHLLLRKTVSERTVMVTGAGGSIGSELCRQIGLLSPTRIILVEMTEHALYLIEAELREAQEDGRLDTLTEVYAELGNVADNETVSRLFQRWRPDTVFHVAAYKHVPLIEENVLAGMRNNIFGTLNCALAASESGVRHFILVSTDKAVRPTNVMGASKRVCELILQALADCEGRTRFAIVRFGNVLGSSGSVVPRFKRQIRDGGPVTLTHRDVTRYFMTIPEAAQLIIQAGGMAEGGEVYVLDMGEPIRIYDLARTMIRLSGLTVRDANDPNGDIEICEVGLRKGEKLYEELLIGDSPKPTHHPRIMQAREAKWEWRKLSHELSVMREMLSAGDREGSLQVLCGIVPEFKGEQSRPRSSAA